MDAPGRKEALALSLLGAERLVAVLARDLTISGDDRSRDRGRQGPQ
jgi:hypothetical protein